MNRILYSCLFTLTLIFTAHHSKGQLAVWCLPNTIINPPGCIECYNPLGNVGSATVVNSNPSSATFSWNIVSPGTCGTPATFTCGTANCSSISITYPCCGEFTIFAAGVNTLGTIVEQVVNIHTVVCLTSANLAVANPTICRGEGTALTASGANTYSLVSSDGTTTQTVNNIPANVVVSPQVNTNYTVYGTTAQGCIVSASAAVVVHAATVSAVPAAQTMCLGSLVCFTASGNAITGSNVGAGTFTTGLEWFDPSVPPLSMGTSPSTCVPAQAGTYSAVLSYSYPGAPGACTVAATSSVTIGTSINVSVNVAPSATVCPGQLFTLTAVSIQTAANQYTWTNSANVFTFVGNPYVTSANNNRVYNVDVDYFGCPGTATIAITMHTLTPTVTVSSPSICPGTSFTMTASGGTTYTYRYIGNPTGTGTVIIPPPNTGSNQAQHTPTALPATYSVTALGGGCSGGTTFTVQKLSITPTLSSSSPSVCPNTNFNLMAGNVGAGVNYTFVAPYAVTGGLNPNHIASGPGTVVAHNAGTNINYANPSQTYSVLADSAGCTGEAAHTVFVMHLTPTLTPHSPSICPNSTVQLTSTGGAGSNYTFVANYATGEPGNVIASPSFTINNVVSQVTVPLVPPRQYTVFVDSAGCRGSATTTVGRLDLSTNLKLYLTNQVAGATHTVSSINSPSVCPATVFTLNATGGAGTTFTITGPPNNVLPPLTPNTATHSLGSGAFPGTYSVQSDSAGCTGTNTVSVSLLTLATVLSATPNPVCSGIPVQLSATGGSNTIFNYLSAPVSNPTQTSVISASTTANQVTATPGPTANTAYAVIADSLGCTGASSIIVTIAPGLVVNAASSSPTVCSGTSVTLTVTGPANASYSWAAVTGTVITPLTPMLAYSTASDGVIFNPTVTTDYSVTGLDPSGCVGSAVITVSINPTASLTLTMGPQNTTICPGHSATLHVSGANSYTWSPVGSIVPSAFVPTVIASPSVTTIYSVVGTNNAGCYGFATMSLVVNAFPQVTVVPTAYTICPGFTSTLTAFNAQTYTWTGTTFSTPVYQQSIAVGPGNYTVIGSNGGTCLDTTYFTVFTGTPLTINVSASSKTTCIVNNNPKFSKPVVMNASGASNYVWLPYNPLVMTYSLGPSTTVRPPASTCYTVIGNTSICAGQTVICIDVIPQFTMAVTPPLPAMCLGDSLHLKIANIQTGTNVVGPVSAFTYSWTEAENAPPISLSPNNLQSTVMAFPQNTTTYTVEVGDARQCRSIPRLVTVTVFPRPLTAVAIPTINNVPTNTVCFVGPNPGPPDVVIALQAENKNQNLQFGIVPTYTWLNPYTPPYNSILTPPNNPGIIVSAPTRTPPLVTYTVISGYNGIPGCTRFDTVSVRVVDCRPVREIRFRTAEQSDTICTRDCITFMNETDTMAGGPQKVNWTFQAGNPPTSNDPMPTVCYNLPGRYSVILSVANPYPILDGGSRNTQGYLNFVRVVDVPNITIVPPGQLRSDTTVRFGTEVQLKASGGLRYQWSPNYNISSLTEPNVSVKPFRNTQYILTGYNSKNCASSDTINVIVIDDCGEMFVPNAFSPNGDGHNDVLQVKGICLETLTFMIFNRWGEKVFETRNQEMGWDGTYKGQPMNTGVFVYRLEGRTYDGKAFSEKGNVTLVR